MVASVDFTVIPNVADTFYFNNEGSLKPENIFRFAHVSTLKDQKNPEGILRTFAKLVTLKFVEPYTRRERGGWY